MENLSEHEKELLKSTEQYARTSGELFKMIASDVVTDETIELINLKKDKLIIDSKLLKDQLRKNYYKLKSESEKNSLVKHLTNVSMAYLAGFIARKIFVGNSDNVIRKISGVLLEIIIANEVYKNADFIKSSSKKVYRKFVPIDK